MLLASLFLQNDIPSRIVRELYLYNLQLFLFRYTLTYSEGTRGNEGQGEAITIYPHV